MAKHCEICGKVGMVGSNISHAHNVTKRRWEPNLQRVKALVDGEVRYIRVTANAIKQGLVIKAPKRTWKKEETAAAKA